MKNLFVIAFLILACSALGQQVHKINGTKYYLHPVEAGNTLYGISKQYAIEIADIVKANPVVKTEGLKVNQTLLIPVKEVNKKEVVPNLKQDAEAVMHVVQPKETLFGLSKKYDVSIQTILTENPSLKTDGLKLGATIRIPIAQVKTINESIKTTAKPDSLLGHKVQKGETLYALSKKYEVSVEALRAANDQLPFGLAEGMMLRLPGGARLTPKDSVRFSDEITDILEEFEESTPKDSLTVGDELEVALLLPFLIEFPDSNERNFKVKGPSRVAIDFYRGFRMALDSVSNTRNINIRVSVHDTGRDTNKLGQLCRAGQLANTQLICGPFYTTQLEMIADAPSVSDAIVLCPIPKPSKVLFERPNVVKSSPSEKMQLYSLTQWVYTNFADSNLFLVNSNKITDQDRMDFVKAKFREFATIPDTSTEQAVTELKLWDINNETLTMRFKEPGSYTLFVPSASEVFLAKLFSELYNLTFKDYSFRVIGIEDWVRFEENFDIKHLHTLKVHLPVSSFMDYDDPAVSEFMNDFKTKVGYEPSKMLVQGFDLGICFLNQLATFGPSAAQRLDNLHFNGLVQGIDLQRISSGSGLDNRFIEVRKYEAYKLKKVAECP